MIQSIVQVVHCRQLWSDTSFRLFIADSYDPICRSGCSL